MLLSEQDIALAWIGVSDPIALGGNFKDSEHVKNFAANLEAAILAKLAAKELPEPFHLWRHEDACGDEVARPTPMYLAAQLQQAHAQGFAAGAAAQLAEKPNAKQFQTPDGKWHSFLDLQHEEHTIEDGRWPIRELYTRREA